MEPVLEEIENNLAILQSYEAGVSDALAYWTKSYLDFSTITNALLSTMATFASVRVPLAKYPTPNIILDTSEFWYWVVYAFKGMSRVTEDWRKNIIQNY